MPRPLRWADDEGFGWSADKLPEVRALAHAFLGRYATALWADEEAGGIVQFLPIEGSAVPAHRRMQWLADQHRDRMAKARLTFFEETAGELAIRVGGDVRSGRISVFDAQPPSPYGLLMSPAGLGYTADGMPLIAANWGPTAGGRCWVTWWADMRDYAHWLRTDRVRGADRYPHLWSMLTSTFGLLHHIHSVEIETIVGPETVPGDRLVAGHSDANKPEMRGAMSALMGAWHVLTAGLVESERLPADPRQTVDDHQQGIVPSRVTKVLLPSVADPGKVWERPSPHESGS